MKKLLSLLAAVGVLFYLSSCSDDDDGGDPNNGVTIGGIPATAEVENEGTYTATLALTAEDGLASLAVSGAATDNVTYSGETSATYDFSYTATAADADQNLTFTFTATDVDGDSEDMTLVLSVGDAPEFEVEVIVDSNITEDTEWTSDHIYILESRVTVLDGVTLTIQPGTIIKGGAGTQQNAKALLVARGGILMAEGTADNPIIFTSVADNIDVGETVSPNLDPSINGLWGGVIVLGNAPISAQNDSEEDITETQIEGIPTSDSNGLYGGDNPADSSGVLTYISIRHGGTNIGQGNEINGLTLGGVGSRTVIENIEIVANQDDGIEWFGGTVDVTNALIWNAGDDALDSDQAWNGTCDNFIIITPVNGSAFELDGPEGTYVNGNHTFSNGTVYAGELGERLIDFDDDTNVDMTDIYFYGITTPIIVEEYSGMADNGGSVANFEYTLDGEVTVDQVFIDVPASELTAVAENANTVGADVSVFDWTWASEAGALSEIGLE